MQSHRRDKEKAAGFIFRLSVQQPQLVVFSNSYGSFHTLALAGANKNLYVLQSSSHVNER